MIKRKQKEGKKISGKAGKVFIVLGVIVLIEAVFLVIHFTDTSRYKMTEPGYQMIMGIDMPVPAKAVLKKDKNGLSCSNGNDLDSSPVYLKKDRKSMILTNDHIVIKPHQAFSFGRLKPFTKITEIDDVYFARRGRSDAILDDCFLFDGQDTYVFLRDTIIQFGDTAYTVSPMSYVTVIGQQGGCIYNYASGEYIKIPEGSRNIKAIYDKYITICLDEDKVQEEDSWRILPNNPEKIKTYK